MPLELRGRRPGFTLIELLVSMAIIAILVGLLLPAIQQARESARQVQCRNQLKGLGLALQSYHEQHDVFPPGVINEWSWISQLLPHLEQPAIYQSFDFGRDPFTEPNTDFVKIKLPVVLCPSDPISDQLHVSSGDLEVYAHTNYHGTEDDDVKQDGMFGYNSRNTFSHVTDGASQTLFVGERGVDQQGETGWWVWDPIISAGTGFRDGTADSTVATEHFWSHHPGGANFLLVDGSVRFVSYSISQDVFSAVGTKSGRETIAEF